MSTNVSRLLFTSSRVYKVKRAVSYPFVDLRSREAREAACRAEVELNSRLAPDVYEGVGHYVEPSGAVEPVVVMERLPADRKLSVRAARPGPGVEAEVRRIAGVLARFHAGARRGGDVDANSSHAAVTHLWCENFAELREAGRTVLDADELAAADGDARRFLGGREALFAARVTAGRAVDGHGDLLADDIFCLDDGPRILDCLEFSDVLRHGDVLLDVSLLALDLERLGRDDLASLLLATYREQAGDTWPDALAHFYVGYRATMRAKIACIRAAGGDGSGVAEARQLVRTARDHLRRASVHLVLVGGLPGTGKSTLAAALGGRTGWTVLRSDLVRKELAGVPAGRHTRCPFETGMYARAETDRVYAELLARAGERLRLGEPVVVDASFVHREHREGAAALARESGALMVEVRCACSSRARTSRLRARRSRSDAVSDATPEIADQMAAVEDPWPSALVVRTAGSRRRTAARVAELLRSVGTSVGTLSPGDRVASPSGWDHEHTPRHPRHRPSFH